MMKFNTIPAKAATSTRKKHDFYCFCYIVVVLEPIFEIINIHTHCFENEQQ